MSDDPAEDDAARIIDLRATNAGDKTHEREVWLRTTTQSAISAHVTFIGTGISVKLTGWNAPATRGQIRLGWPQGQMTLQHHEAVRLRNLLSQWLAMSEQPDPGEYLVVRLDKSTELGAVGAAGAVRRITQVLSRPELATQLTGEEFSDELLAALEGHVRLRELRSAVDELRTHLSAGDDDERTYQDSCDRHPWAFGSAWLGAIRFALSVSATRSTSSSRRQRRGYVTSSS